MSWMYRNKLVNKLYCFFYKYYRKFIQFGVLFFYNIKFNNFKIGSIYNGPCKNFCVPGLNCYSCPGAIASCPIGILENLIINYKHGISFFDKIPFLVIGSLMFFGICFGRAVCGFFCPFGLIQELFYNIKTPKIKKNNISAKLTNIKYFIFVLFVIFIPFMLNIPSFCKFFCPVGVLEAGIPHVLMNKLIRNIIGFLFLWKVSILVLILIFSIFIFRPFCRFFCPLGAIYGLFNNLSVFKISIDKSKCINCNACINNCKMDVKKINDKECIHCGECIKKCKRKAIKREINI